MENTKNHISITFPEKHTITNAEGFVVHFVSILKAIYNKMPGDNTAKPDTTQFLIYHCFRTMEELIDLVIKLGGEGGRVEYLEGGNTQISTSWKRRHTQKNDSSFRTFYVKEKNIHSINMITIDAEEKKRLKKGYRKPTLLIAAKMELLTFEIPKDVYKKSKQRKRYMKVPKALMENVKSVLHQKQCTIIEDQGDSLILFFILKVGPL